MRMSFHGMGMSRQRCAISIPGLMTGRKRRSSMPPFTAIYSKRCAATYSRARLLRRLERRETNSVAVQNTQGRACMTVRLKCGRSMRSLTLLLLITAANAQASYKYRDDEGHWVYTDRKPSNDSESLEFKWHAPSPRIFVERVSRGNRSVLRAV